MIGLVAAAAAGALLVGSPASARACDAAPDEQAGAGLAELRHVVGNWAVQTEFLDADGRATRVVDGSYEFEWAIPGSVVRGIARQPGLEPPSALLLYVRPATREVEMVSVSGDGTRWVMTGAEGSNMRSSADRPMSDGSTMRLRFTRFDVEPDRFRSKMEYSTDGGATWTQGNRQSFVRRGEAAGADEARQGPGKVDAEASDPLAPLRFLSGACWRASFPGKAMADIQCVESMAAGRFLRARHVVRGSNPEYGGETIYWADGRMGAGRFIYFTSLGGVSRGGFIATATGAIFPDQRHTDGSGRDVWIHGEVERLGKDRFRTVTRRWTGSTWTEPFALQFERLPEQYRRWVDVERMGAPN